RSSVYSAGVNYLFPLEGGWRLCHHSSFQMKKLIVKYIGSMFQQLDDLYIQTKTHFSLHCFSSLPILGFVELQCVVELKGRLTDFQFSFHKWVDWLLSGFVLLTIVRALPLIYAHVF